MGHEPSGFVANAKRAMQLVRAYALLATVEARISVEPLVERDFAVLKDCPHRDGELLAAVVAHVEAGARGRSANLGGAHALAVRANGTVRPMQLFQMLASLALVA